MRHLWENRVLEVCELMYAVLTWASSEPCFETMVTTEIIAHLSITEERRPFSPQQGIPDSGTW